MLVEGGQGLLVSILKNMEPASIKSMNGFVSISDNHIH